MSVPLSELPCSGLGQKADVDLTIRTMAFLIPTDTFRGQASFKVCCIACRCVVRPINKDLSIELIAHVVSMHTRMQAGGLTFELVEAHGETHDQLFVWLPRQKLLMPGDNYYRAFPNLYTIRGTTPRPIRSWIQSLDDMRKLEPEYLVPSHTEPVIGKEDVAKQLTDYRDGITWVYVETIRVRALCCAASSDWPTI